MNVKTMVMWAIAVMLVFGVYAGTIRAEEKEDKKPKVIKITGKVTVTKDEKGKKVIAVSIGSQPVKMDGRGKSLAKEEGKTVDAEGTLETVKIGKGEEATEEEQLRVKRFKVKKEKKEKVEEEAETESPDEGSEE